MEVLYLRRVFSYQFDELAINRVVLRLITKYFQSQFVKMVVRMSKYLLSFKSHIFRFKGNTIGVAFFIAKHIRSNIRELEGALKRIDAYSRFHKRTISVAVS